MKEFHFIIDGRLPGLNELVAANRKHKNAGGRQKAEFTNMIEWAIRLAGWKSSHKPLSPAQVMFEFYEPTNRRDPDNIESAAKKFILDAMVKSGVIMGDCQKHLHMPEPFIAAFFVDEKNPRIEVSVREVD